MRNYETIAVEAAALQVVAPKRSHLRVTETSLDLGSGVGDFIRGHIQGGLADSSAKAAKFLVQGEDRSSGLCSQLLASGSAFVELSGELAQLLYSASQGDERVSDGSFLVARCRSEREIFLAMLKLDPSNQYRTVEGTNEEGLRSNRLEVERGILPSVRERLLKAAFVRAVNSDDYDMLILDKQRPGEVVSRFFIQDFLGAEPAFDDKMRTLALYRSLLNTRNEVATTLDADETERLDSYIRGQVVGESVNIDDLISNLPTSDDVRLQFRHEVEAAIPDREFDIDTSTATRLLKSRKFVGDNGLSVTAPENFFQDMVSTSRPGADGLWTITIRTRKWQES